MAETREPREINLFLRKLRQKRKWSQKDAVEACNWPQSKVSKLETGGQQPTIEDLGVIAKVYRVPLLKLVKMRAA